MTAICCTPTVDSNDPIVPPAHVGFGVACCHARDLARANLPRRNSVGSSARPAPIALPELDLDRLRAEDASLICIRTFLGDTALGAVQWDAENQGAWTIEQVTWSGEWRSTASLNVFGCSIQLVQRPQRRALYLYSPDRPNHWCTRPPQHEAMGRTQHRFDHGGRAGD